LKAKPFAAIFSFYKLLLILAATLGSGLIASSQAETLSPDSTNASSGFNPHQADTQTIVLPKSVRDPLEPFNRVMWGFNKALMTDAIKPTSRVYRFVVVKPIRTGIGNFGINLMYPGRLINNLLQGKCSRFAFHHSKSAAADAAWLVNCPQCVHHLHQGHASLQRL
jgi:hypothetical protein